MPEHVRNEIHAGFIPLIDCAPLVIAAEQGFDAQFGFQLRLYREVSWANIRDKIDVGAYDCAHMLAPMPIATALGLGRTTAPIIVPMALNLNGNAITVSAAIFEEMLAADPEATRAGGMNAVQALKRVVDAHAKSGMAPLTLGMVFPFSSHNYDMRYWLAAGGIDPDNDVNLIVIPPPLTAENLRSGRIDGFCAGEPWNSVAVSQGAGRIVATKSQLWSRSPEKVLGVRAAWAEQNPQLLDALIKAIIKAGQWLEDPRNCDQAADILSKPQWVGTTRDIIRNVLSGTLERGGRLAVNKDPELVLFHSHAANFPWRSHALWILSQMIRWGQVREPFDLNAVVEEVYRPEYYRKAAAALGISVPHENMKREGDYAVTETASSAAKRGQSFFGSDHFDPLHVLNYLEQQKIRSPSIDLTRFKGLNASH
ncbi:Nitrate transporter [Candidatus Filomicrobium marinum]|uniref:Nitrate transporter n=1 Tax=Candidatus Filomicrobium marinum TaxID=1608628 RepID=A0A0D6JEJ3_9HYPH|nr:CmpA/NrtA family ABC transporter substrate-binding protein [Candidatus Filomicrobium marinum]CFX15275.1 Nitrate transporter [Candidatus Filomicrobium marinum]CPR17928.1 Nitrate transporter [Candidatus Filomicrobium marinum]